MITFLVASGVFFWMIIVFSSLVVFIDLMRKQPVNAELKANPQVVECIGGPYDGRLWPFCWPEFSVQTRVTSQYGGIITVLARDHRYVFEDGKYIHRGFNQTEHSVQELEFPHE